MLKQNAVLRKETPFPEEVSIRIEVIGLAFCDLNTNVSEINFLRHIKYHSLSMRVVQKRRDGEILGENTVYFDEKHNISVSASGTTEPRTIYASLEKGEGSNLDDLINLSKLHHPNEVIYKKSFPQTTVLSLQHCTFYTAQMTEIPYEVTESVNQTVKPPPVIEDKLIGYSLGGKMNFEKNPAVIKIDGPLGYEILLPNMVDGEEAVYDIIFDNHCTEEEKCKAEVGDDTDFKFYYDVLQDSEDSATGSLRKFVLTPNPSTSKVAACNVVIRKP